MNCRRSYIFLIALWWIFSAANFASAEVDQSYLFEKKSKLEDTVVKKYRDRISTRLSPDLFSVGAQITITIDENALNALGSSGGGDLVEEPSDLTLGMVPALDKRSPRNEPSRSVVRIDRVIVYVGLSNRFTGQYRNTFTQWLNQNVQSEFGVAGQAVVSQFVEIKKDDPKVEESRQAAPKEEPKIFQLKMEPKSIEIKMPEMTPQQMQQQAAPRELTWHEKFGNLQNLIGLIVLALLGAGALIAAKFIPSKDARELAQAQIRVQEMKLEQANDRAPVRTVGSSASLTGEVKARPAGSSSAPENIEYYRDCQRKVAWMANSLNLHMTNVVDVWLDGGERGRKKLAATLDGLLTQPAQQGPRQKFAWLPTERLQNDRAVSETFRTFAGMAIEEKTSSSESAYWDLMVAWTLGEAHLKQRFAGLANLSAPQIQQLLNTQEGPLSSLALLHLPPEKLSEVTKKMKVDDKRRLIDSAFEGASISQAELDTVNNYFESEIKTNMGQRTDFVNSPALITNLLPVLRPSEEILLLRDLTMRHRDRVNLISQQYPSLAFVAEWPEEQIKLFFRAAQPMEILALVRTLPEVRMPVLAALPVRTQAMVQEDLDRNIFVPEEETERNLSRLRDRAIEMTRTGELRVLTSSDHSGDAGRRAA